MGRFSRQGSVVDRLKLIRGPHLAFRKANCLAGEVASACMCVTGNETGLSGLSLVTAVAWEFGVI